MDNAEQAYIEHYQAGRRHPLLVERQSYGAFIDHLVGRGDLTRDDSLKALQAGRIRINNVLVIAFDIR